MRLELNTKWSFSISMDWFLYDTELRHKELNVNKSESKIEEIPPRGHSFSTYANFSKN